MERWITAQDVEDIAVGGAVLGTGGGGDPYIGKLMAQQAIAKNGPVRLISVMEVPEKKLIITAAMMGTPTVLVEKIPRGDEFLQVFKGMELFLRQKPFATMSIEAGGVNSTVPIAIAAILGIPLVDADGMGRAFPELQMVIPTLHGVSATPMCMADDKGNLLILSTVSNQWTEMFARSITVNMGGSAMLAIYSMTGGVARKATVRGSLSLAARIGKVLRQARSRKQDPLTQLLKITKGKRLFRGKIVDVKRRTEGGFVRGEVKILGSEDYKNRELEVQFQNENLVASLGEKVLASVPDLITILDQETSYPITTESLKYGLRVTVIGIPCDPQWRTPEGLKLVGPQYFGYPIQYTPM